MSTIETVTRELNEERSRLQLELKRIDATLSTLTGTPVGTPTTGSPSSPNHRIRTRTMSPEARARISKAMKANWKHRKSRRGNSRVKAKGRKQRIMSAEARAKISAAQKARWAALKQATKAA